MSENELATQHSTGTAGDEQEEKLVALTYAKVTPAEKEEIEGSLLGFGFREKSLPEAYKTVMRIFARSASTREAAKRDMHLGILDSKPELPEGIHPSEGTR